MSQSIQVVFPYQWGSLSLEAPLGVPLDAAIDQLRPEVFFVQPSVEGWAELRARVLQVIAALPPVTVVGLRLSGPAPVAATGIDWIEQSLAMLGWSHEDLANQLGVASNTVWRWFSGRTPLPPWVNAYLSMALQGRPRQD